MPGSRFLDSIASKKRNRGELDAPASMEGRYTSGIDNPVVENPLQESSVIDRLAQIATGNTNGPPLEALQPPPFESANAPDVWAQAATTPFLDDLMKRFGKNKNNSSNG